MELITAIKQVSKNTLATIVVSGFVQNAKIIKDLMDLGVVIVSSKPENPVELNMILSQFNSQFKETH